MHALSALQNVDLLKFTFLSTSPIRPSPIHISQQQQLKFSSCLESIKTFFFFLNHMQPWLGSQNQTIVNHKIEKSREGKLPGHMTDFHFMSGLTQHLGQKAEDSLSLLPRYTFNF